ncbi:hypothetical protein QTP88_021907 [Uroleucon formosanum]
MEQYRNGWRVAWDIEENVTLPPPLPSPRESSCRTRRHCSDMKRSSLFVCCSITLLYLSDRLDSRTVAPIVYLTTAIPNVADPNGYYDGDVGGQSGYYGGGAGGKAGYYGGVGDQLGYYGGSGGQSGYYGGSGGQSRSYGGPTGYYGGRSPTAAATMYGSYGHRTMLESAVRDAIRPVRNERSHALYESPNTYEYMKNPPRKSGKVSRVPETERLPPGDDVEFIDDGGGGDNRRPAKDRRRDGDGGEQSRDIDDRPRGHQQNNNSKRTNRNKPKTTSGRKLPALEDDYTNDGGGGGGGDAEPLGSSTTGGVRERANAKKPRREEIGRKTKHHVSSGDGPIKHKIHKKNEYSKRQQFFDEEHVDHGKKKPKNKSNHDGHKNNGHGLRKHSKKKERQQQQPPKQQEQQSKQQQRSTQTPVRRTTKREQEDDRGTSRVVPQGYGQVVAVR